MSSNIGPVAQQAYQKYLDATTLDDKIKKLEEFLSVVPKHKATEKIVALNRARLAKLKREQEEKKQKLKSTQKIISPFSIKKEGIQIILISDHHIPGVGKTSILKFLTNAVGENEIGKFTSLPEIGIYNYKNIRFQIVDMPSIMKGASSGVGNGKEILAQLRSCDLICICIDLSRNVQDQAELLLKELINADIRINIPPPPITIEKTGANKVQVFYLTKDAQNNPELETFSEKIKELVQENGIKNAIVKIYGKITIDQVLDALSSSVVYKKALILATKGDLPLTERSFDKLKELYSKLFIIIAISITKESFPVDFGEIVLKILDKIRIYTSNAGIIAQKPLVMSKGATVKDVALKIHKSFYELFNYAIIIRKTDRQQRKKVGLDYELEENDIIEIHTY
jgi:ribosome-interacting GTPase 1